MEEDEWFDRFGLHPKGGELDEVRSVLIARTIREQRRQGDGDSSFMKLCCVQLFNAADLADALLIWAAKSASFDCYRSIDVQLLCGAGIPETKSHLSSEGSPEAAGALTYLLECEMAGDFDDFTVEAYSAQWDAYYRD